MYFYQITKNNYRSVWEQRKLGELSKEVIRKAPKDSSAPIMMISASSGFVDQSTHYATDNTGSSIENYTLLMKNELSYNHGYSKQRNFGSVFTLRVKEARIPFVYHSFAMPGDNSLFFGHYLNSGIFDGALKRLISSTARMDGLMNISYDEYMSIVVFRPSIEEQDKIATFFDNLDSSIVLHQRKYFIVVA
jgi:type I restriction enzyme S subunit